jgi:RNA polymerase sigma factor FliA
MPPRKSAPKTIAKVVSIDTADRAAVLARRDELFHSFADRVPEIAASIKHRLPPCFELDDLISTGYEGLLRAATTYRNVQEPGYAQPVPFAAHAYRIVHGFMINTVRRRHWKDAMAESFVESPTDDRRSTVSEAFATGWAQQQETALRVASQPDREAEIDAADLHARIAAAVGKLPPRLQKLIELYYSEGQSMQEIADSFGVNCSRISQLHTKAMGQLRQILRKPAPKKPMGQARIEDLPPQWQEIIRKLLSA